MRLSKTVGSTTTKYYYVGTQYYFTRNALGDIVKIVNASSTSVVGYTYDAWGNIANITSSMASTLGALNLLRYRGYVYDTETGLYYVASRYYDPEIGRFICADGYTNTRQGLLSTNMYAYCENNPVSFIDPSGNSRNYCVMLTDTGGGYPRLITDQSQFPFTKLHYGSAVASETTCEVIATYNALALMGYTGWENSIVSILDDFEDANYPLLFGYFGTWPSKIGKYMKSRGISTQRFRDVNNLNLIDEIVNEGSCVIVSVWNDGFVLNGIHTFVCARTAEGWDTYNRYYDTKSIPYDTFMEILENDDFLYAYIIP